MSQRGTYCAAWGQLVGCGKGRDGDGGVWCVKDTNSPFLCPAYPTLHPTPTCPPAFQGVQVGETDLSFRSFSPGPCQCTHECPFLSCPTPGELAGK